MKFPKFSFPSIINILLILPLAFGFSKLSGYFLAPPDSAYQARAPRVMAIPAAQQMTRSVHPQQIARLHLFGKPNVRKKPVKPVVAPVQETRLNLTLRGIAAENDKHDGLAIIQQPNKQEKHFKVGDTVFGLATIKEIYADHIVLLRNGKYETLRLPEQRIAQKFSKPVLQARNRHMPTPEEHVAFMRQEMKKIHKMTLSEMRNPWQYIYFEPAMENGRITGLKLANEDEKEFFARYGLELGDVITSVNGNPLNRGGGVAKAMNILSDGGRFELVINRKGAKKTFTIDSDDEE